VVEDVAGVVGVAASVVGAAVDVDEEVVEAVEADGEREAARHGCEVGDDGYLVRMGSCTHTSYLARHCRES